MPPLQLSAVTLVFAQIAAIVLVSRAVGVVTRRLGQPLAIAEIVAGILLGPSLLGWLWPQGMEVLFPASSMPGLKVLSQLGLVLFMFLVGLEFDARLLKGRTRSSIAISQTSILLPLALGGAAGWWLHGHYGSPDVPFVAFVLFLGTAMCVTAFPVLARILSERQLIGSRVGTLALACAAVADVTAWCLLAFVVAISRAGALTHAIWTTSLAILFTGAMLFLLRPFLVRLSARVVDRAGLSPAVVAITLLILLFSSTLTEIIGIHALFGAFLFGAIVPKQDGLAEALFEKLETVAVVLLLPLFFAYSGLRTQISLLAAPGDWLVAGALVAVAILGKFGGSSIAARLTGLGWREASAIGVLLNTRGLMILIVLNIGLDLGVLPPAVFTMMVLMGLVTTFLASPVMRWVYPDRERARERLAEPPVAVAGAPPSFTVLLCVSDRTTGDGMAKLASALTAARNGPARVFALHLSPPTDRPSLELRQRESGDQLAPLAPLLQKARSLALDVRPLGFVSSDPAADICRTAEAKQASLVLLGWHKPLLLEGRLGGTVNGVVARSSSPVAVLVDRGLTQMERILVAFTGGREDLEAVRVARRLGQAPGAQLTLLHVARAGDSPRAGKERPRIEEVLAQPGLDAASIRLLVIEHQAPPDAVLEEASRGYDLLVLGMHARWGLGTGALNLGRQRILTESPVSVLAVHPPLGEAVEQVVPFEEHAPQLATSSSR